MSKVCCLIGGLTVIESYRDGTIAVITNFTQTVYQKDLDGKLFHAAVGMVLLGFLNPSHFRNSMGFVSQKHLPELMMYVECFGSFFILLCGLHFTLRGSRVFPFLFGGGMFLVEVFL